MFWLLIILLLIPQIAKAECGWVLWWRTNIVLQNKRAEDILKNIKDSTKNVEMGEWRPHAAFDTRKECIEDISRAHLSIQQMNSGKYEVSPKSLSLTDNKAVIAIHYPEKSHLNHLECWPSNIKPE